MHLDTSPICEITLGVSEKFRIQRTRLTPDSGTESALPRMSVVTGTHGDELEGQYVAWELIRRVREDPGHLTGVLDVYPALNPLGIDSISRGIPNFDLDLNRLFPGNSGGCMPEYYAREVTDALSGSDLCVDVHASNIFLREIPQIRVNELTARELVPLARLSNVDFVWVHAAATVLEATLAHSLNMAGTPCLVLEAGIGMRLTTEYGDQIVDGLLSLMREVGVWDGPVPEVRRPRISTDGKVRYLNASSPGIFLATAEHTAHVEAGEVIGRILNPLTGEVAEELTSPASGLMFTLRAYPVVYEGSLIARVLEDVGGGSR